MCKCANMKMMVMALFLYFLVSLFVEPLIPSRFLVPSKRIVFGLEYLFAEAVGVILIIGGVLVIQDNLMVKRE